MGILSVNDEKKESFTKVAKYCVLGRQLFATNYGFKYSNDHKPQELCSI